MASAWRRGERVLPLERVKVEVETFNPSTKDVYVRSGIVRPAMQKNIIKEINNRNMRD